MNIVTIQSGKYEVIISEGGASVITDPGCDFYSNVTLPADVSKLKTDELQKIADLAVADWEIFLKPMDDL